MPKQLPSPPPDGEDIAVPEDNGDVLRRQKFREDILLDFAALESSILRIQLIQLSNQRERERYAAEKASILKTAQAVKDNTMELRAQLVEAQRVLELRKGYDELATKLIDPKKLKPRAETTEDIERLEKEIEDLEQESSDYEGIWVTRREAFDRVVSEGQAMIRVIKGIKDELEPEKDESMEDGEDGEMDTKGERSRMGSPAPGSRTPMPNEISEVTPLPEVGESSPARPANKFLEVDDTTRGSSRTGSPLMQAATEPAVDVEMALEDGERLDSQRKLVVESEADEPAATPGDTVVEQMDET